MTNGSDGTTPPVVPAQENAAMQDLISAQARVITSQNALILYYQDLVNTSWATSPSPAMQATGTGTPKSH